MVNDICMSQGIVLFSDNQFLSRSYKRRENLYAMGCKSWNVIVKIKAKEIHKHLNLITLAQVQYTAVHGVISQL